MAWLLAALTFSAALEIHPAGEAFESAITGQIRAVPQSAHPITGTHVEASFAQEVPGCPACLLRSQTGGARLLAVAKVAAPALGERAEADACRPHPWRPACPSLARAPPLA